MTAFTILLVVCLLMPHETGKRIGKIVNAYRLYA